MPGNAVSRLAEEISKLAGAPVDFVADIAKESELEQVWIEALAFEESADEPDIFFYRLVLREYTEREVAPSTAMTQAADLLRRVALSPYASAAR